MTLTRLAWEGYIRAVNDLGKFIQNVEDELMKELPLENYSLEENDDQLELLSGLIEETDDKKKLRKLALAVNDLKIRTMYLPLLKTLLKDNVHTKQTKRMLNL